MPACAQVVLLDIVEHSQQKGERERNIPRRSRDQERLAGGKEHISDDVEKRLWQLAVEELDILREAIERYAVVGGGEEGEGRGHYGGEGCEV